MLTLRHLLLRVQPWIQFFRIKGRWLWIPAPMSVHLRGRFIIIVLVTSAVLAFGAFWNSRQGSWLNSRLIVARAALQWHSWDQQTRKTLPEDQQKLFDQSKDFAERRGFADPQSKDELRAYIQKLQEFQTENVNFVRIPFFGVVFDVNDLGLIAGFTFLVILGWFRFSVARELSNIQLAFGEARSGQQLARVYNLLAMRQVLTVPRIRAQTYQTLWAKAPYALYALPFAVQLIIFVHDLLTFSYGWTVSPLNTIALLLASVVFLALMGVLTYLCLEISLKIDGEWKQAAEELKI